MAKFLILSPKNNCDFYLTLNAVNKPNRPAFSIKKGKILEVESSVLVIPKKPFQTPKNSYFCAKSGLLAMSVFLFAKSILS